MAIISCPFCGHKISDKSANCNKCNGDIAGLTPQKRESLQRDKALNQAQSLVNHSMFALLLFLAGFGLMYWWDPDAGSVQQYIAGGAIGLGFCWYMVSRARIMLLRRRK
ncbi:zinc ribbon domain-containing protein [Rheinheimera maricola]|uniref:Zinc ribbon domain-containing protein n=1 Tax=Rheinheimera maricola TaxID=2793282 RepID=A0ABS7X666_9GAMM|nr:zinc ribbon domain-containing protein [Rheinheimera maricola]MBZ9611032.1 zinc ribbon domain-containing protein [Rheinheimera maricola]